MNDICIAIERRVRAGAGLCKGCIDKGLRYRWVMVRRYVAEGGDERFDRLLGVGEGAIAPKGQPDNLSDGVTEWLFNLKGNKVAVGEFTCLTKGDAADIVGAFNTDLNAIHGHPDGDIAEYFGINWKWEFRDDEREQYRLVVWRAEPAGGKWPNTRGVRADD